MCSPLPEGKRLAREHPFDEECQRGRKRKGYNAQVNLSSGNRLRIGEVEAFNRRMKERTTKWYHYNTVEDLTTHKTCYSLDNKCNISLRVHAIQSTLWVCRKT